MNVNFALQDQFLAHFFAGPLAEHFYLTGGTALTRFYFHHRESLDLELFTNDFDQDFSQVNRVILGILHTLPLQIKGQVVTDTFIQYIVTDLDGNPLKVDLVKDVPVHFGSLVERDGIRLDSLENIGSNKVLAVVGHTDAKDFVDLYWILQHTDLQFDDLYRQAREKDLGLSELYLAYALQNVEKIRLFPRMLQPLPWEDMKAFIQALARELLKRRLFRRRSTGEAIEVDRKGGAAWKRFAFPTWWHYDVLRVLEYLRSACVTLDEPLAEAIELVASKCDGDGRLPLETWYPIVMPIEMDIGECQPSWWNTLRALRVLDWDLA